jgi:TRAP-type C4-dicarboxylate transport system permease small subunit
VIRLKALADRGVEAAAIAVTLALLAVVVLGIASRLVNDPLVWTDELARYLMVWLALLGWIIASRRRAHIRITVLIDRLPRLLRLAAEIVIQLALAVFGAVLAWHSLELVDRAWDVEAVSLPISSALLYALVPLAGLAVVLQAAAEIVQALRRGQPALRTDAPALT